ncbi:hypothetical protein EVAR_26009_1 [Eumeta japonica]|uniref:Uncharacterized protein n=1 Tax=Eumeta variegata TaxID=151549 RepID=A0A4C1VRW9_EUMVA|nr:hypothetical protein EVAR_26009_1 [Eumeta japonica]
MADEPVGPAGEPAISPGVGGSMPATWKKNVTELRTGSDLRTHGHTMNFSLFYIDPPHRQHGNYLDPGLAGDSVLSPAFYFNPSLDLGSDSDQILPEGRRL